ncbi:MAG: phosphoribosylglycinamide formyltransferase [Pseudomonadota bacterium]
MNNKSCRVVVLASGSGSNFQAFIDETASAACPYIITGLVSDKPDAFALERARKHAIPTTVVPFTDYRNRSDFDAALADAVTAFDADLVILAGFMRIIGGELINRYRGRMLNIHPALLPKYKGLHTHQRCLDNGDIHHGTTVHFVTAELDDGPSIVQAALMVTVDDTASTLNARVQAMEHQIFPMAARWFAEGRIEMQGEQAVLDGIPLASPVVLREEELLE